MTCVTKKDWGKRNESVDKTKIASAISKQPVTVINMPVNSLKTSESSVNNSEVGPIEKVKKTRKPVVKKMVDVKSKE